MKWIGLTALVSAVVMMTLGCIQGLAAPTAVFISSWDRQREGQSVRFRVLIDGQPPGAAHGIDVDDQGNGTAAEQWLYQLIRRPKPIKDRQFEPELLDSGVEACAFTKVTTPL